MSWKDFSMYKLIGGIIILLIGIFLKFPIELESYPAKYKLLFLTFTESQYQIVNYIAIILILVALIVIILLLLRKFKAI